MTRKIAKSAKISVIVALLVLMVMGIDEVFADNQSQVDLHEFDKLLQGVDMEIMVMQGYVEPVIDTTQTTYTEFIKSQISYLEAFEEVINKQIF